jgi:hypothetical protein
MVKSNAILAQEVQSKRVKSSVKSIQSIAKTNATNAAKKLANFKTVQALENAMESFPEEEARTDSEKAAILQLEAEIEGRLKANIEIDFQTPELGILSNHSTRISNGEIWEVPEGPVVAAQNGRIK